MKKLSKAVFLDRDGTINKEADNLRDVRQLKIFPGIPRAIRILNSLGYLVIVATNQPVVARGWITEKKLKEIHTVLVKRLAREGAKINAIYYCPHHPNANVKKYRIKCKCRKPNIGMVMRAKKDFNVDLKKSFMIGDTMPDIVMGKRAKLKTILVKTGAAKRNDRGYSAKPDFILKNLLEAVKIVKRYDASCTGS